MVNDKRVVFLGVKRPGEIALRVLVEKGVSIAAVITRRGAENQPVVAMARKYGIPVFQNPPLRTARFIRKIRLLNANTALNFSYPEIFKERFIDLFPYGCINFHPAILPRYRGRYPTVWPILYGDKVAGYTMHYIDKGVDTGDIIDIAKIKVSQEDTGYSLYNKLIRVLPILLKKHLPDVVTGRVSAVAQKITKNTYFSRLPGNGKIEWGVSAERVQRFIRALYHPRFLSAFTLRRGRKVEILKASWLRYNKRQMEHKPGELFFCGGSVFMACSDGYLRIESVRVRNKELAKKAALRYFNCSQ